MHKYLKRPGIKALKFIVEVHILKVELKLAQQCRISVIFKRGITIFFEALINQIRSIQKRNTKRSNP